MTTIKNGSICVINISDNYYRKEYFIFNDKIEGE